MATVCLLGLVTMKAKEALVCHRYHNGPPYVIFTGMKMVACRCGLTSNLLLWVQEHPKALQAEVALTLKVWENITDSALATILGQPLHTLSHIHSQLQTCTQPQPTAEHRPLSRHLSRWLHRLQEAQSKETPGCLEASVTLNLFRLLTWDLKYVASEDQCV
eukprot:XP_017167956.1 PREDICTED: interferon lambda-2-like [Mus musculus]